MLVRRCGRRKRSDLCLKSQSPFFVCQTKGGFAKIWLRFVRLHRRTSTDKPIRSHGILTISSFRTTISSFRRGSKGCAGWVALEGDGHAHILMGPCSARRAPWGKLQRVSTTHILQEYVPFSRFFHACACARFLRTLMGAHQLARPCITPRVYVRASLKRGNKK